MLKIINLPVLINNASTKRYNYMPHARRKPGHECQPFTPIAKTTCTKSRTSLRDRRSTFIRFSKTAAPLMWRQ